MWWQVLTNVEKTRTSYDLLGHVPSASLSQVDRDAARPSRRYRYTLPIPRLRVQGIGGFVTDMTLRTEFVSLPGMPDDGFPAESTISSKGQYPVLLQPLHHA